VVYRLSALTSISVVPASRWTWCSKDALLSSSLAYVGYPCSRPYMTYTPGIGFMEKIRSDYLFSFRPARMFVCCQTVHWAIYILCLDDQLTTQSLAIRILHFWSPNRRSWPCGCLLSSHDYWPFSSALPISSIAIILWVCFHRIIFKNLEVGVHCRGRTTQPRAWLDRLRWLADTTVGGRFHLG